MESNLYGVIGLTPEASDKDIYRAVKKTAKCVKESDAPKSEKKNLIKYIKRARDTLMDPTLREEYDRTIGIDTIRSVRDDSGMTHTGFMSNTSPLENILGSSIVPFGSSGSTDPIGSMLSNHMDMIQSIIPDGFGDISSRGREMKSGTFHFMEYTKVRNPSGGFDEFGVTREGDTNNDRVTEKRFHKKG